MPTRKVAIVGAGISGLAAAYDLQKSGEFEVTLFEQSNEVGGKIQTASEGEFLIERGPDSIFASKPWATDLMREIGMDADLMEPLCNEFSILTKGKLHHVPRALASMIPSASGALEKAAFLSAAVKKRALKESDVRPGAGKDESIASFFRRRFGKTFSELVAEPLLAGTHAGDPEKLSMAALYPTYLGMEREHGSITKSAEARKAPAGKPGARMGFCTLRSGMGSFPQRLLAACELVDVQLGVGVSALATSEDRIVVESSGGARVFDHVISAVPGYAAADILRGIAPDAADALRTLRYVSTAVFTLAFPRGAFRHEPSGNGFLVPRRENSFIKGCTVSSNKWAERAPGDSVLIRAFVGQDGGVDVDALSDEDLREGVLKQLNALYGLKSDPIVARLDRWPKAMAQYELGHLDRLAAIERALCGLPITLVGASYRGNSIPDCVRQGREAAQRLLHG